MDKHHTKSVVLFLLFITMDRELAVPEKPGYKSVYKTKKTPDKWYVFLEKLRIFVYIVL